MADEAPGTGRSTPGGWFVLAPAIALVVGLLLGGAVVWAGQGGTDDGSTAEGDPTPSTSPTAAPTGDETAVVVPSECLEAADTVQEATEVFRDLASALRDFRAGELSDLLGRLETLEAQAREQADACRQVEVSSTSTASPST